ncbi:hypothetical protein ACQ4PT_052712 [Festuca glaucescens]
MTMLLFKIKTKESIISKVVDEIIVGITIASQLPPVAESPPPAPTTIFTIGDDLLLEIFVRLPSLATLVRAAFACRTFLHAVCSSPTFRPRFRALHPPPLIGLFVMHRDGDIPSFAPLRGRADPDQAALIRGSDFFLTRLPDDQSFWNIDDCRDGYLLLHNWQNRELAAYSPLDGALHRIPSPLEAVRELYILSSHAERHGSFRLVCIHTDGLKVRPVVFSSDTGEWQVLPWTEAATINKHHPEDDKHCLFPRAGRLVNGRIYWTRYDYLIVLDTTTRSLQWICHPSWMGKILSCLAKPRMIGSAWFVQLMASS